MTLLSRLRSAFSESIFSGRLSPAQGRRRAEPSANPNAEAFLTFAGTGEVVQAESILQAEGLDARVMAPPATLRTGCDMVIVTSLMHAFRAVSILKAYQLTPLQMTPVGEDLLEPVSLFQHKDFGDWLMVRAANMKITVEKASGRIVNVSGGGCPDVPYLAAQLIGKNIYETDSDRKDGQTLCGYALHLAAQELRRVQKSAGG